MLLLHTNMHDQAADRDHPSRQGSSVLLDEDDSGHEDCEEEGRSGDFNDMEIRAADVDAWFHQERCRRFFNLGFKSGGNFYRDETEDHLYSHSCKWLLFSTWNYCSSYPE